MKLLSDKFSTFWHCKSWVKILQDIFFYIFWWFLLIDSVLFQSVRQILKSFILEYHNHLAVSSSSIHHNLYQLHLPPPPLPNTHVNHCSHIWNSLDSSLDAPTWAGVDQEIFRLFVFTLTYFTQIHVNVLHSDQTWEFYTLSALVLLPWSNRYESITLVMKLNILSSLKMSIQIKL